MISEPDTGRAVPVSCVMLSWRDTDTTIEASRRLLAFPELDSLILVDNESDGSLSERIVEFDDPRVVVLDESLNLGFSAGVNVGLRQALGQYPDGIIVCLNNDAHFQDHDSFVRLVEACIHLPEPGMVAPVVCLPDGTPSSTGGRFRILTMSTTGDAALSSNPDFLTWACVAIHPDVLRQHGLLNERFFLYWEDVEFGLRLRAAKVPMHVTSESVVIHAISSSHGKAGPRIQLYSTLGVVGLARQIGVRAIPGATYRLGGRLVQAAARGDWARLRATWSGIITGLAMDSHESAVSALQRQGTVPR